MNDALLFVAFMAKPILEGGLNDYSLRGLRALHRRTRVESIDRAESEDSFAKSEK